MFNRLNKGLLLLSIPFIICAGYLLAGFYCATVNLDAATLHGGLLLALGWFLIAYRLGSKGQLPTATTLASACGVVSFLWGWSAQVTPISDFARYLEQATRLATQGDLGAVFASNSPVLVVWHAGFQWLLGASHVAAYLASAVLWAVQGPLLIGALINFGIEKRTALLAGLLYLLGPGIIAFAPVVSAESMAHTLLVLSLYVLSGVRRWEVRRIVLLALLQALMFLTLSNSIVFALAFLLSLMLISPPDRPAGRPLLSGGIFATVFLICLALFGTGRWLTEGDFSLTAAPWRTASLVSGTNFASHGMYTSADLELAGYRGANRVPVDEANRRAVEIAWERISFDPLGFAKFALTTKVNQVWGDDTQSYEWATLRSPVRKAWEERGVSTVLRNLINAYWVFLLASGALGGLLLIKRLPTLQSATRLRLLLLGAAPCMLLALSYILLDVRTRYHTIFVPFIALASAFALRELSSIRLVAPARAGAVRAAGGGRQQASAQNRRRQRRVPIMVSAEVITETGLKLIGKTRDLSVRGVFLIEIAAMPLESECSVGILLETAGQPIRLSLKGKVVRIEEQGMALEFTAMTRECYENLQFVIAHNAAAQRTD